MRRMQQQRRKGEPLLLILGQLVVPALRHVQQVLETLQPEAGESAAVIRSFEFLDRRRVSESLTKRTRWQIRSARHVEQLLARWMRDAPGAPRPQAGQS